MKNVPKILSGTSLAALMLLASIPGNASNQEEKRHDFQRNSAMQSDVSQDYSYTEQDPLTKARRLEAMLTRIEALEKASSVTGPAKEYESLAVRAAGGRSKWNAMSPEEQQAAAEYELQYEAMSPEEQQKEDAKYTLLSPSADERPSQPE